MPGLTIRTTDMRRAVRRVAAVILPGALALTAAAWSMPVMTASSSTADSATTTYVVATNGSDSNAGTTSQPFRTVSKGLRTVHAGDTLLVRAGTYAERIQNPTIAAGTSTAPITVANYPGERPVISGLLWLRNASYWRLSGVNVTWNGANNSSEHMVKLTGGTGWSLTDAEIWGAHSYAGILVTGGARSWRIAHSYVHDTYQSNSTNQDHLIYVNNDGAGVIEGNVLANSTNGRAIKLGPPAAGAGITRGVTIRYNTMSNNLGPSNVQPCWNSYDNTVYRNIMVRPASNRSAVTAYQLTGTNNVVRDNLVWNAVRVMDSVAGLVNGGGNLMRDPQLVNLPGQPLTPTDSVAVAYGAMADPTRAL
jgi:hypothetical protein